MAESPIPEGKKERMIAAGMEAMAEVMPWSAVKQDYVALYLEHDTEEELREIIELCKDPRYKKMIAKQVELISPSLEIGQKYGQRLGAKMMDATMKIMLEP